MAQKCGDKCYTVDPTQPGISSEHLVSKGINWRGTNISPHNRCKCNFTEHQRINYNNWVGIFLGPELADLECMWISGKSKFP